MSDPKTALEMASQEAREWHELYMVQQKLYESALERLREIAALAGTTKRKQAGCEMAVSWLYAHGYTRGKGGYVPGVGFEDGAPALLRRQAE